MIDYFFKSQILPVLFFVYLLRSTLYHVYLWQLKEYKPARIIAHLTTLQGRKLFLNPFSIVKLLFLILIIWNISSKANDFLFFATFAVYALQIFAYIYKGTLIPKYPKFTFRAYAIVASSFFINIYLFFSFSPLVYPQAVILTLDRLLFFPVLLFMFLSSFPSFVRDSCYAFAARKKIEKHKKLRVIGITGSFGKTSVKEFTSKILSKKFKVLKTAKFQNTMIAVARTILHNLTDDCQIFVVEMGAYKRGEIEDISKLVRPDIGVISGIGNQHLSLFGGQEEIVRAKFELISNLSKNSLAIFNMGSKKVLDMVKMAKQKRSDLALWGYKRLSSKDAKKKANFQYISKVTAAKDVIVRKDHIQFKLVFQNDEILCRANLLGRQNVDNLLAAACACLRLGYSLSEVAGEIKNIKPPPNTMRPIKSGAFSDKLCVVDDTFNANYDGVLQALNYMSVFEGRKVLVLTPLIELGKQAEIVHEKIGRKAGRLCDYVFTTNYNYHAFLKKGVGRENGKCIVKIARKRDIEKLIKEDIKNSIFLFEGKEAGDILEKIR